MSVHVTSSTAGAGSQSSDRVRKRAYRACDSSADNTRVNMIVIMDASAPVADRSYHCSGGGPHRQFLWCRGAEALNTALPGREIPAVQSLGDAHGILGKDAARDGVGKVIFLPIDTDPGCHRVGPARAPAYSDRLPFRPRFDLAAGSTPNCRLIVQTAGSRCIARVSTLVVDMCRVCASTRSSDMCQRLLLGVDPAACTGQPARRQRRGVGLSVYVRGSAG
jgi:hypothetical protein